MRTLVHFGTADSEWAVPIERVQEVRLPYGITPLPVPKAGIAGLLRHGDEILTVLSVLGGAAGYVLVLDGGGERFGLIVESALGILRVERARSPPRPPVRRTPSSAG